MGNIMVGDFFDSFNPFGKDLFNFPGFTFTLVLLSLVVYILFKFVIEKPWTNNAAGKQAIATTRAKRQKRFDEVKGMVESQDEGVRSEILALSLTQLREALQKDKYTARAVLFAYSWKALQVQEAYNCLCEFLIESFAEAEAIDEKYSGQANKPPLYGIPFSVKGNFFLKNYDCCIGLAANLDTPLKEECTFVTHLRNLGAIPFVYTNVPMALMSFVCSNVVYGTTGNPHDVKRTPGGSSGGEACLMAAGGVPFGTGSDLAGSLRIPAAFCGLVTLKPCQERFVVLNSHGGVPGRGRLGLSFGFFTKSVDEQILLLGHVFGSQDYSQLVPKNSPAPMRTQIITDVAENKTLRIGYYSNDGYMKPTPGCARVVQQTVEKLRAEGHELVHFRIPTPELAASTVYKCIMPEGGAYYLSVFNNNIVDPYLKEFVALLKVPKCLRWLASYPLSYVSSQATIMSRSYVQTPEDVRVTQAECDDYVQQFTAQWKELGLDALICPAFPVPPVPHEYPSRLGACAFSTALYNMLDYPAGVVPTGSVTKEDDDELLDEEVWPTGNNFILKMVRKGSANSKGLPLGVQVVTLPYEEEKCLGVMKIVEKLWNN